MLKKGFIPTLFFIALFLALWRKVVVLIVHSAKKTTHAPIKNEADNGLANTRGTLAMARTSDPDSATAQFFINYKDNAFLNHTSPTASGWGYAVFAEVIEGMDVVDAMAKEATGNRGPHQDVPKTDIVIQKAEVVE